MSMFSLNQKRINTQRGFTLFELIVAIFLLGIVSITLSPTFKTFLTAKDQSYRERAALINTKITQGFLDWAEQQSPLGALPPIVNQGTPGGLNYAPADPSVLTAGSVSTYLNAQGVSGSDIINDGFTTKRVRVYQVATGLSFETPFYFQSGPLVFLSYQFGAVYQSACATSATCNSGSSIPGGGAALASASPTTWTPPSSAINPVFVSSLPLQKKMLKLTSDRVDKLRDALTTFYRAKVISAAPNDTTNWYPTPTGGGAPALAGSSAPSNQNCWDGWYILSASNVNILEQIGLSKEEYQRTAWGGDIEYCRDYDPGLVASNTTPHYAAIRFLRDLSVGNSPDSGNISNNVILSF